MSLLSKSLIRAFGLTEGIFWERALGDPCRAQQDLLLRILRKNESCEFGRMNEFASIHSEREFKSRVPIQDFELLRQYINRMLEGDRSVLTRDTPVMFALTSGTTAEPKFLPVTPQALRDERALLRRWYYGVLRDHPKALDHARLAIVGSASEGYTPCGIPFGSASGMVFRRIPGILRKQYVAPECVADIKNYEARYFVLARLALGRRVSFMATPNPSTFIRLAGVLDRNGDALIRAVYDGVLGVDLEAPDLTAMLLAQVRPDPERARQLSGLLNHHGTLRPMECWPDLRLIGCWLGGSVGAQAYKLAPYYGDVPLRDLGYMASEGHFSVPMQDHTASGVLAIRTCYYEFIPEEELEALKPATLTCRELEVGKRYGIIITTTSGLYRYDIKDIIEVTGFYRNTPLIKFVRKSGDMTNITGEKLHVNQVVAAFEEIRITFELSIVQFRVTADTNDSCYVVWIELAALPTGRVRSEVVRAFDEALAKANIEYGQKRRSQRLGAPKFHLMACGWAEAERERFARSGKRDIQFKWKVLSHEPGPDDVRSVLETVHFEAASTGSRETRAETGSPKSSKPEL